MRTTIVVGVDGSIDSERALDYAAYLAHVIDGQLLAVYVFRDRAIVAEATGTAGAAGVWHETITDLAVDAEVVTIAHLQSTSLSWEFETAVGDPTRELLRLVDEHDASMLVIGRHGHPRLAGLFGRSVSERLVREADVPIVVVPHHPRGPRSLTGSYDG